MPSRTNFPPFQSVDQVRAAALEFLDSLPSMPQDFCAGQVYFKADGSLGCDLLHRSDPVAIVLHQVLIDQFAGSVSDENLWYFAAFVTMAGCLNGCAAMWLKNPNLAYRDGRPVPLEDRRIICPSTLITADSRPELNLASIEHMISFFLRVPDIQLEPGPWTSLNAVMVSEVATFGLYN